MTRRWTRLKSAPRHDRNRNFGRFVWRSAHRTHDTKHQWEEDDAKRTLLFRSVSLPSTYGLTNKCLRGNLMED